jgi:hypothetical protein
LYALKIFAFHYDKSNNKNGANSDNYDISCDIIGKILGLLHLLVDKLKKNHLCFGQNKKKCAAFSIVVNLVPGIKLK